MVINPYCPATRIFDPERRVCIQSPEYILGKVDWGQCVHVGSGTRIQAEGGVRIGNFVVVSYDCVIWSIYHDYQAWMLPYGVRRVKRPVVVEDFVWIGRNAVIGGGIRIGEGAIIGMGAVVTRDVPPLAIMGGNPARRLGFRPVVAYFEAKVAGMTLWSGHEGCGACENPDFYPDDAGVSPHTSRLLWSRPLKVFAEWQASRWIKRRSRLG